MEIYIFFLYLVDRQQRDTNKKYNSKQDTNDTKNDDDDNETRTFEEIQTIEFIEQCVCDDNDRFIGLKYCLIDDKFVAAASAVVVVDDDYQSNEQKWWNFFLPQILFS